jgi:hypothetical protein
MKKLLLAILLLISAASAQVCKSNQVDMLNYMAPQLSTLNGHYNTVYPFTGRFYWVKSANGYPWDVDNFDRNYIYQSITEQDWNNPYTYKIFEKAIPWMPRCVNASTIGKVASILLTPDQTKFDLHVSCRDYTTHDLGYVVNEIWANLPTLTLSYRYSCDNNYDACKYKETFAMQNGVGLTQWTYYTLQNGVYVQQNQTNHGAISIGSITPKHPCWQD